MKKTVLATLLIGAMGAAVVNAATENAAVTQQVEQMKSQFNLNDQQANRISNILSNATTPAAEQAKPAAGKAAMTDAEKAERRAALMEKRLERRLARMKENLELSDEQVAQLKTLMTQQRAQRQTMREQAKADIAAVLTPEQAAKLSEMRGKGNKGRGRGHRGGRHHGKGMRGGHRGGMCDK